MLKKLFTLAFISILSIPVYGQGQLIVPDDYSTIQAGIDAAAEGDTVLVSPGTYYENISFNGKNIVLGSLFLITQDTSYVSSTIIDGNESGSVVTFTGGEDRTAELIGFTIQNGFAEFGGGIRIGQETVNIQTSPTIKYCTIKNNSVIGDSFSSGGGIYAAHSSSTFSNLKVFDNSSFSSNGGGIFIIFGDIKLDNSIFKGNYADVYGGAITIDNSYRNEINSVTFENNTSKQFGSGIHVHYTELVEMNKVKLKNHSNYSSIFVQTNSNISLTNSIISENNGGVRISGNSSAVLKHSTIANNTLYGIHYAGNSIIDVINSIIYSNQLIDINSESISFERSSTSSSIIGDWNTTANFEYLTSDPLFDELEPSSYKLSDYSPGIGLGSQLDSIEVDIGGNIRPNPSGSNPDIGAYENELGSPLDLPSPTNISADSGEFQIYLAWEYNQALSSILDVFEIYRGTDLNTLSVIDTTSSFSYVDSTVSPGNSYYYAVSMLTSDGRKSPLTEAFQINAQDNSPVTATSFTAELINYESIKLTWLENSEPDLKGYNIYRSVTDSSSVGLYSELSSVTEFIDTEVQYGNTYYYGLAAVDSSGNESTLKKLEILLADTVKPGIPQFISSISSNSQITLSWEAITDEDLGGYRIYRGIEENDLAQIDSTGASTTQLTDQKVENGTTYFYSVSAVDTLSNESQLSELLQLTPQNALPRVASLTDITVNDVVDTTTTVRLTAEGSSDTDGTIDSTLWYKDEELISDQFEFDFNAPQGTTPLTLKVIDNSGGSDAVSFDINVSANYRSFNDQNAAGAGVSLIGSDYLFLPLSGGIMQILDSGFVNRFDISVGGEIRSVSSIAPDTTVYLAATDRTVYSFDRRGIPLWNTPLGGELQATPTIDMQRDLLYVGVSNSNLFAIDRADGSVIWSYRLENPITQPGVIIGNQFLLIITEKGNANYFDLDGQINNQELVPSGQLNLTDSLSTSPAIDAEGYMYAATKSGRLIKFEFREDLQDQGQIIWESQTNSSFNASPVIGYDGTVFLGASDSTMYAFNGSNGAVEWRFKTEAAIATTATINSFGVIYVGDVSGKIYAIDEFGQLLWFYKSNQSIGNATAYTDGHIIFSTLSGDIHKIYDGWRYENSSVSSKVAGAKAKIIQDKSPQWGTYQGNNRRSGNMTERLATSNDIEDDNLPRNYSLTQNYPNPFNPSTQISYTLPVTDEVRLDIFNSLGQRVATLVNESKSAGMHTAKFDASRFSSGVYFYTIQAGGFRQTKKMMLIK